MGIKNLHTHYKYIIKKEFDLNDEADDALQEYLAELTSNNPNTLFLSKAGALDSGVTPYDLTKPFYNKVNNQESRFYGSYILPVGIVVVSDNPQEVAYIKESGRGDPKDLKPPVIEDIKKVENEIIGNSKLSYGYAAKPLQNFFQILKLSDRE